MAPDTSLAGSVSAGHVRTKSHHGVSCVVRVLSRAWGGQAPGIHTRRTQWRRRQGTVVAAPSGTGRAAVWLRLATTRHFPCLVKQQTPQNTHCCTHQHHALHRSSLIHSFTHSSVVGRSIVKVPNMCVCAAQPFLKQGWLQVRTRGVFWHRSFGRSVACPFVNRG